MAGRPRRAAMSRTQCLRHRVPYPNHADGRFPSAAGASHPRGTEPCMNRNMMRSRYRIDRPSGANAAGNRYPSVRTSSVPMNVCPVKNPSSLMRGNGRMKGTADVGSAASGQAGGLDRDGGCPVWRVGLGDFGGRQRSECRFTPEPNEHLDHRSLQGRVGLRGYEPLPLRTSRTRQLDEHQLHEFHLDQHELELDELDDDDDECAVQAWVGLRGYESLPLPAARTDK